MTDDLLEQILANPRHIALRLVYADQLLERGDPRGELIQLECTPGPKSPERRARRDELVKQFEAAWQKETGLEVTLDRGFVSNVRGRTDLVVAHAARIAREPVRELRVLPTAAGAGDLTAFAALPALARIEKLVFYRLVDEAGLAALAASTTLSSLRSLELHARRLPADATWARQLRQLVVKGLQETARDWPFGELTALELASCHLDGRVAELLQRVPRLQSLKLAFNRIGVTGANALARVALPRLSNLELYYEEIGELGVRALTEVTTWPALRRLSLSYCRLGDAAAAALVASPLCANLVELDLSCNVLSDASARAITDSLLLANLRVLNLGSNPGISHDALRALVEQRPGLRLVGMKLS